MMLAMKKTMKKKIRLTQSVACAGCASKLNPVLLRKALKDLKPQHNPNLIVGFAHADDAAIYKLSNKQALVQTVDFFTPIVDDPTWYGRVAAANALSDVYAMGGKPLTALNIFCYPEELGPHILKKILAGGLEKMREARCTLVGGHSVTDKEMKYGLSVTGVINPNRIFSNEKLKAGQALVFTKKLGTGIVTTAAKFEDCPKNILNEAIRQMAALNEKACAAMLKTRATACTDVTGFSFLGHLSEMTKASKKQVRVFQNAIPYFKGIQKLVAEGYVTRGDRTNRQYAPEVKFKNVEPWMQSVLFDPQTSGGLLISMPFEDVSKFQKIFEKSGGNGWLVGEVLGDDPKGTIFVE
jgi:selenide,water dikinase